MKPGLTNAFLKNVLKTQPRAWERYCVPNESLLDREPSEEGSGGKEGANKKKTEGEGVRGGLRFSPFFFDAKKKTIQTHNKKKLNKKNTKTVFFVM